MPHSLLWARSPREQRICAHHAPHSKLWGTLSRFRHWEIIPGATDKPVLRLLGEPACPCLLTVAIKDTDKDNQAKSRLVVLVRGTPSGSRRPHPRPLPEGEGGCGAGALARVHREAVNPLLVSWD